MIKFILFNGIKHDANTVKSTNPSTFQHYKIEPPPVLSRKKPLVKPEMSKKNKWLHPQDDLGFLERGMV